MCVCVQVESCTAPPVENSGSTSALPGKLKYKTSIEILYLKCLSTQNVLITWIYGPPYISVETSYILQRGETTELPQLASFDAKEQHLYIELCPYLLLFSI